MVRNIKILQHIHRRSQTAMGVQSSIYMPSNGNVPSIGNMSPGSPASIMSKKNRKAEETQYNEVRNTTYEIPLVVDREGIWRSKN